MNITGAIILAAGKGTRMKAKNINKVAMHLANKPIILHAIDLLHNMQVNNIVVVVGFAKDSVIKALAGKNVIFADQKRRLGTAHAVKTALSVMPENVTDVLVIQGDDCAFYSKNIIETLLKTHQQHNASLTMLTIDLDKPFGLGRVVRNHEGKVIAVVEEKDATDEQRRITEINPACYVFKRNFLSKYLPAVKKSPVTGEYYLPGLIHIAIKNGEKLATVKGGRMPWRGVNTKEELAEAELLFAKLKS